MLQSIDSAPLRRWLPGAALAVLLLALAGAFQGPARAQSADLPPPPDAAATQPADQPAPDNDAASETTGEPAFERPLATPDGPPPGAAQGGAAQGGAAQGGTTQPDAAPAGRSELSPARQLLEDARTNLRATQIRIERVEAALQREGLTREDLARLRRDIEPLDEAAQQVITTVTPQLAAAEARLRQLGEAPKQGESSETDVVAQERARQTALVSDYQDLVKQARVIVVRVEQALARIGERRRELFANAIFEQRRSALSPSLWLDFVSSLPVATDRLSLLATDWAGNLRANQQDNRVWMALLLVGIFLIVAGLIREFIKRIAGRDPNVASPSNLSKSVRAGWAALTIAVVPSVAIALFYTLIKRLITMPSRVDTLLTSIVDSLPPVFVALGLVIAMLAPHRPNWRLIELPTSAAVRISGYAILAVMVFQTDDLLEKASNVLFVPDAFATFKGIVASLLVAVLFALSLRAIRRATAAQPEDEAKQTMMRWRWLQALLWLIVIAIPIAALLGYQALARFLSFQLVSGSIALAILYLLLVVTDNLLTIGLQEENRFSKILTQGLSLRQRTIEQTGIVLSGLIRLILIVLAASFLLTPWGLESRDLSKWIQKAFFGFQIGDLTISLSSILLAAAIFLIGVLVTRAVQRWLENRFLPRTRLDIGVRNSVKTAFGYVGLILAAIIGFSYLGLDLSNLAIVAGALSVGIGFGLQSVVNNFVSGLILLAERPIKTGDWIVVGADEGYVQKISVRSTQIETFDRATVIVPNSDLISGVVKNWMHTNNMGRIRVPIGVSYDCDPEQVRELLMSCATDHKDVLRYPAPRVYFMSFGASSLDFELRVYIGNIDNSLTVGSDLRFAVFKCLKENGIEIPYPQQDIHIRDIERIEQALAPTDGGTARKSRPRKPEPPLQAPPQGEPGTET